MAVACAAFLLTGCYAPGTTPASAPTDTPSLAPAGEVDEGEPEVAAVLSIAAVDIDGEHVTVGGYLSAPDKSGGACTYEVTSTLTGDVVTATTVPEQNGATTSCGATQLPIGEFSKGPWQVTLHYVSDDIDVTSDPLGLEIP